MTILKVSKQKFKKNSYAVLTDNGTRFLCSDEIMVKYGIAPGATFSDEAFAALLMDAQRSQAMDTALRLLGMQPRSRNELAAALKTKKFAPAVIETVLARIAELGYLNDELFAHNRAAMLAGQGKGPALIRYALAHKGISPALISEALAALKEDPRTDALEPVRALARKHMNRLAGKEPRVVARKLMALLARRGFDPETSRTIIRELREELTRAMDGEDSND